VYPRIRIFGYVTLTFTRERAHACCMVHECQGNLLNATDVIQLYTVYTYTAVDTFVQYLGTAVLVT
jgi:hypothetical protein